MTRARTIGRFSGLAAAWAIGAFCMARIPRLAWPSSFERRTRGRSVMARRDGSTERRTPSYPVRRVKTKKTHAVAPEAGVPAMSLVSKLRFVRKWPKAHWRLAFQGNLHELPREDFALIARAMAKA